MYKISYYGINCNAFHWIKDFLTDRTQTVILEGETSNKIPVTSGAPQGTVLVPILFLIFINDLAEYIQHSTLRLFADDSIIYKQIKNKEDVINSNKISMPGADPGFQVRGGALKKNCAEQRKARTF